MKITANDPVHELKAVLAEHLPWQGARIGFLAQFPAGPVQGAQRQLGRTRHRFWWRTAQVNSHYQRLQRFFRSFEINPDFLGAAARAPHSGRRWPVAADAGSHPLEIRRGGHPLPGVGHRLSRYRPAGVLQRLGQGGSLQYCRTDRPDGTLPCGLWRRADRRPAGRPRIRG